MLKTHLQISLFIIGTNLNKAQFKLCVVYDCRMLKHFDSSDDFHPEKPSRIASIYAKFQEYGILKRCLILQVRTLNIETLICYFVLNWKKLVNDYLFLYRGKWPLKMNYY